MNLTKAFLTVLTLSLFCQSSVLGQNTNISPSNAALAEAAKSTDSSKVSDAALDKRVDALVASLELKDNGKVERVRNTLITDLRAVRDAHNAGVKLDPAVHKAFVSGLQAELSPQQVEAVKDKLTVNKVPITFRVYHEILPQLTVEDDAKILGLLKQAREESLDEKNVKDMNPIFKKYKKQIEQYIDRRGYDWAKSYKTFVDKERAKKS